MRKTVLTIICATALALLPATKAQAADWDGIELVMGVYVVVAAVVVYCVIRAVDWAITSIQLRHCPPPRRRRRCTSQM